MKKEIYVVYLNSAEGGQEREIERLVGLSLSPSPPLLVSVETKRGRNMVSSDAPPVSALLPPLL